MLKNFQKRAFGAPNFPGFAKRGVQKTPGGAENFQKINKLGARLFGPLE